MVFRGCDGSSRISGKESAFTSFEEILRAVLVAPRNKCLEQHKAAPPCRRLFFRFRPPCEPFVIVILASNAV